MGQFIESFIRLYPCGYCGDTSFQVRAAGGCVCGREHASARVSTLPL